MLCRAIDVVHGAVGAGVGVPAAAQRGHAFIELLSAELLRPLEHHVLNQMRYTRPGMLFLVYRAAFHPELERYQRQIPLRCHHGRQSVRAYMYLVLHSLYYATSSPASTTQNREFLPFFHQIP